ncbi:MAG: tRNA dimethylallyltransferase, partial [Bilophila sp.]
LDPDYAARIHPNDRQRILRALGVFEATGKRFSWWHSQTPPPPPIEVLRIGLRLPLDTLAPLLAQRIDKMLACGALEEAKAAYAMNTDARAPGWSGIGCSELHQYLAGTLSLSDACALWIKNTRAYAKRQLTWFNADKRILWFAPHETTAILDVVASFVQERDHKA